MKILRYFPLIALVALGLIAYSLYKTGRFINKKVETESLSKETLSSALDSSLSTVSSALDTTAAAVAGAIPNSTSSATTSKTTSPAATTESKKVVEATSATPNISLVTEADLKRSKSTTKNEAANKSKAAKPATAPTQAQDVKTSGTQTPIIGNPKPEMPRRKKVTADKDEVPTEASVVVKTPQPASRFHVVVGSFSSEANANAKAKAFEQKTRRKANVIKQGGFYRVSADDFESNQSATQFVQKLKELGEQSIIVKF